ncbi:uncharacterized protein K452DRAFT_50796 [Aplosporella prunicola CBS 121167]|uniref:Uncharacterized protein n=1 Tax=Aplosporella prunicola CBS 121167 TaxID=1176127 RepID=A0A6A6B9N7_9PEZI|nr:uncharacterized protein K452DRAFT_50796 [Aplosporella prunicola CBS 121167]KAF2140746.1 hypothetical protein K452DRAFT_50796 [Aplosporella prunicola CBS 121167]
MKICRASFAKCISAGFCGAALSTSWSASRVLGEVGRDNLAALSPQDAFVPRRRRGMTTLLFLTRVSCCEGWSDSSNDSDVGSNTPIRQGRG